MVLFVEKTAANAIIFSFMKTKIVNNVKGSQKYAGFMCQGFHLAQKYHLNFSENFIKHL